jgi:para-nitrobenzyl esterase
MSNRTTSPLPSAGRTPLGPIVNTPYGRAIGTEHEGTSVFKGIPYARAHRLQPSEPITEWSAPLDATSYGPRAPQLEGTLERLLGAGRLGTSEDCLSLNVFTPCCDDRRRPVLVWVHGGAFVTGSGAMPWYHGSALASRGDVVVVTLNYRLGALGFTGASNLGLGDQIAALRWVNEAIAAFGGDPANVTVFGESAGGASVITLMAAPSARTLFARGWAMSPSIPQLRSMTRAEHAERELLSAAGVEAPAGLASLEVDQVLSAQGTLLRVPGASLTAFAPTSGGELVPDDITDTAAADHRPLVIGTNRDEMHLFTAFDPKRAALDNDAVLAEFRRVFGDAAAHAVQVYRAHRPGAENGPLTSALQTDETFRMPARTLALRRAGTGRPTWMYWFTYPTPAFDGALGSCHGLDIPFAFHNLARPGVAMFTGDGDDRTAVADEFSGRLIRFAHDGHPGWAPFDDARRPTHRIDVDSATIDDPEPELSRLWTEHGP